MYIAYSDLNNKPIGDLNKLGMILTMNHLTTFVVLRQKIENKFRIYRTDEALDIKARNGLNNKGVGGLYESRKRKQIMVLKQAVFCITKVVDLEFFFKCSQETTAGTYI